MTKSFTSGARYASASSRLQNPQQCAHIHECIQNREKLIQIDLFLYQTQKLAQRLNATERYSVLSSVVDDETDSSSVQGFRGDPCWNRLLGG